MLTLPRTAAESQSSVLSNILRTKQGGFDAVGNVTRTGLSNPAANTLNTANTQAANRTVCFSWCVL